jgi:hypothetical protein
MWAAAAAGLMLEPYPIRVQGFGSHFVLDFPARMPQLFPFPIFLSNISVCFIFPNSTSEIANLYFLTSYFTQSEHIFLRSN